MARDYRYRQVRALQGAAERLHAASGGIAMALSLLDEVDVDNASTAEMAALRERAVRLAAELVLLAGQKMTELGLEESVR